MWIVRCCIRDYDEVFCRDFSEHDNELDAENERENLEKSGCCDWVEVIEEYANKTR